MRRRTLPQFAAELLFPRHCAYCGEVIGFGTCSACSVLLPKIRRNEGQSVAREGHCLEAITTAWAEFYYETPVREAILRRKFKDEPEDADPFIDEILRVTGKALEKIPNAIIIPVPGAHREYRGRGNLPLALAKSLSKKLLLPVDCSALVKVRKTMRQMELSGAQRRKNVRGAFAVKNSGAIAGKNVLLVDDVLTTGSTLNECAKALLDAGAAACFALCVAVSED